MAERITGHTELIGLIATPIRHSMSPTMHNEAFAYLGLDYVYLAFEVGNQELKDVVQGFRAMKLRGFNVSMPNKTEICQYLDKLSPAAQLVGAVNTVVNDDGVLTGHITDGTGYMRALSEAGIDIIGLGTDFDGFSGETDVPDTAHMQHLADVMSHDGFTDEEIEKVFSKNVLRVFRECWK
jgi:shikimate 5-dehydrogenase